jgi:hypothetical protein
LGVGGCNLNPEPWEQYSFGPRRPPPSRPRRTGFHSTQGCRSRPARLRAFTSLAVQRATAPARLRAASPAAPPPRRPATPPQLVAPHMPRGGSVVLVSSVTAYK